VWDAGRSSKIVTIRKNAEVAGSYVKIRRLLRTLVPGLYAYRFELYLAPVRGKPFVFMKSEPDAYRFSVSAYVWPIVFHMEGREPRRERRAL